MQALSTAEKFRIFYRVIWRMFFFSYLLMLIWWCDPGTVGYGGPLRPLLWFLFCGVPLTAISLAAPVLALCHRRYLDRATRRKGYRLPVLVAFCSIGTLWTIIFIANLVR